MVHPVSESGKAVVAGLLAVVLVAALVFLAVKVAPVRARTAELEAFMVDQALKAGYTKPDELAKSILAKARELDLALDKSGLEITAESHRILIRARYDVAIDFPGFRYTWQMEQEVERPVFRL
jgi:hypothetical protein